jgi:hypothetical protein
MTLTSRRHYKFPSAYNAHTTAMQPIPCLTSRQEMGAIYLTPQTSSPIPSPPIRVILRSHGVAPKPAFMTIDIRNWTIFGVIRWTLAVAVLAVIGFVLVVFLDENVRSFYEYYGLDKILSRVSETMPDILFHRETWFGAGVLIGAAAMVWLVWAFPHRLGESNAHEAPLKKWGIVIAIVVILAGLIGYLHFGKQPVLTLSNEDIARILAPVQKELQDTKDALAKAKKEYETAKEASLVAVNVASAPTSVRLQFSSTDENPSEIEAHNAHWTTVSWTYRVSRYCQYPQLPVEYCQFVAPKGGQE